MDPVTQVRTALGGNIPTFLVDVWHQMGSEQVITLAEAFAVSQFQAHPDPPEGSVFCG